MDIVIWAVVFVVGVVASGFFLWVAMKLLGLDGSFWALVLASGISSACALIPFAGIVLAPVVLFWLLYKFTSMDNWLYGVIMVVIARVLTAVTAVGIMRLLA